MWSLMEAITILSKEFDSKGKRRQVWPEDRVIVTANLNINYRAPTKVNQFLVIKSILTEVCISRIYADGSLLIEKQRQKDELKRLVRHQQYFVKEKDYL